MKIDNVFLRLEAHSLVDWGVLLLGIQNELPGFSDERLSGKFVEEFATEELAEIGSGDELFELMASLALDVDTASPETRKSIEEVCHIKRVDTQLSMRKWQFVIIEDLMNRIDPDPLYGLIQLSEAWAAWGWPSDAPTSMRNGGGGISADQYGSSDAFLRIKEEVEKWLRTELTELKKDSDVTRIADSSRA
ncbi:DUF2247 family protein [Chitinimonas sp. BJB300]|uniref:DUF2247 family protein n=1 Tax=Chitinimonas sp. BJB300 TaxID=1559339 RepID=UPI000C0FDD77|nr:DUF2247 family protein [Chitinimonas sp. BJB300]PHV12239.1 hypothetical protein CSQ89_06840 [Chitinimonas sp. BJB300]TSJ85213.1 DUF2247 family protein [Chitinimonas sp. BJB300]